jgi:hypothetical protein
MTSIRLLMLAPEGFSFDQLSPEQQFAVSQSFGTYVMPMPGTMAANGTVICDAIVKAEGFSRDTFVALGIEWPVIGMFSSDGVELLPLDREAFVAHMAPIITTDAEGNVISSTPATEARETSRWAGWPEWF